MSEADYTVYYMKTPNGQKITLALEEMGLPYTVKTVNFLNGDNKDPAFIALNPNAKIPTLVDHTLPDGDLVVFESGAILEYLAEKTGKFLPKDLRARMEVKQWLYFQMASIGPMFGQVSHFFRFAKEDVPYAKNRYLTEATRLFRLLDKRLAEKKYLAADEYTIADMATYWWVVYLSTLKYTKGSFDDFPNVNRWVKEIGKREAVIAADKVEMV